MTSDASDITKASAVLNGSASINNAKSSNANAYFYYSTTQADAATLKASGQKIFAGAIPNTGGDFSVNLGSLLPATTYYYVASVYIDDQEKLGGVKSFTTSIISVESVSLNETEHTFYGIGHTLTLIATVKPDDATDKTVTWTSSNTSVATVSEGKVRSIAGGTATITAKAGDKSATCAVTVIVPVSGITLSQTSLSLEVAKTITLTATVKPDNATDKTVTWTSSNTSVATVSNGTVTAVAAGTATITAKAGDKSATCVVTVFTAAKAVDLGLSVKWASYNVGASKPEEDGDLFAWGETEPKNNYSWSTYKWCNGSETTLTKYNTSSNDGIVDNKTKLEMSDDAARANWGGLWRMPTYAEVEELCNNCTWYWYKGQNLYEVTSKKNGNRILLPASKDYWSSSLFIETDNTGTSRAYVMGGRQENIGIGAQYRFLGRFVRPVYGDLISVTNVSLSQTALSLEVGNTATLTATVNPDNATDKTVAWISSNTSVAIVLNGVVSAIGTGTATITAIAGDKYATCTVTVIQASFNEPEAVDLGLSVKWASCNMGANAPEAYGLYFAWGETEPKSDYDWSTYKWCNGDGKTLTKYNTRSDHGTVDNKTVLDPEDDVAHVKLGGKWRMPTNAESDELKKKCKWTWTSNYNGTGVAGMIVTSKKNGNSIFLPAAGSRDGTSLNHAGSHGVYWSSLNAGSPGYAWYVYFNSEGVNRTYGNRYCGLSVRPVSE